MRPGAHQPLQAEPVGGQHRQFQPGGKRGGGDRHDLRPDETRLFPGQRGDMLESSHHALRLGRPLILAGPQVGIGAQPVARAINGHIVGEAFGQSLWCRGKRAGKRSKTWNQTLPFAEGRLPVGIAGKQTGKIPGIARSHRGAGRQRPDGGSVLGWGCHEL